MAAAYRTRWTIEGRFQTLTDVLRREMETLGSPRTALFSFAVAVLAWNVYAVVKAALRSAHGRETIATSLSDHHLLRAKAAADSGVERPVFPIDGKTQRRRHDRRQGLGALHSVSPWAADRTS